MQRLPTADKTHIPSHGKQIIFKIAVRYRGWNLAAFFMDRKTMPTPNEQTAADTFTPTFRRRALHSQILVVAKTRIENTWKAYIFPVPGQGRPLFFK